MRLKLWLLPVAFVAVVLLGGCSDDKPDQKKVATMQWNRARANVLFGLAKDQYTNGNFDPARKTVDEALRLDPDNEPLRVLSARLAIENGQLELADQELERARKTNPKDADADYLSGVVYQRWQKPELAMKFYITASEKEPSELAYLLARTEMLVAMNKQDDALHLLQEKVVYFENSAVIRDAVGQLLVQAKKYGEAADMLRQASILATEDRGITEHLAFAQYFAGRYADSVDSFQKVLKADTAAKRPDILLAMGRAQLELGKFREARETLDQCVRFDEANTGAWMALGRASLQLNDMRRAELSLRRAQTLAPDNSEARLMVGYLRLKQNKFDDALASFQRAAALDRSDTVSICMIGLTLKKLGRDEEASRYYAKALKMNPKDEMASKLMASVDMRE